MSCSVVMNMKHQIGQRSVVGMPLSRQPRPQNNNHMLRCLRVVAMTAKKSVVEDGSYQNNAIHFSSWWQRVSNVAGQALLVGILLCAGRLSCVCPCAVCALARIYNCVPMLSGTICTDMDILWYCE